MTAYPRAQEQVGLLKKAPVIYTIIALKFPTELIGEYISEISRELKSGFIRSNDRLIQSLRISSIPDGSRTVEKLGAVEYVFHNPDKTFGFTLKDDLLFVHTSEYPGFEDFSSTAREILSKIAKIIELKYFESLGIRYIDAVIPTSGKTRDDYIKPFLRSYSLDSVGLTARSHQTHLVYKTELGNLILRCFNFENTYPIPPDLQEPAQLLVSKITFEEIPGPFSVIDTDHIYSPDKPVVLDVDDVIERLDAMHTYTTAAFIEAVEPQAIEEWR